MSPETRQRRRARDKAARDAARAAGMCTTCRKRPREEGRCRCVECNAHRHETSVREQALQAERARRERELMHAMRKARYAAARNKKRRAARAAAKRSVEDRQQMERMA